MEIISALSSKYNTFPMKVLSLAVLTFVVAAATTKAQTGFIDRLEAHVEGQGDIKVDQDPRLTDIVNGVVVVPSSLATTSKVNAITTESKVRQDNDDIVRNKESGMHRKVRGYRVQVYFGGNQRADQMKAQKIGEKVTSMFPELRAYTTFESLHWRCRIGDFINREDASAYMHKIKAKGIDGAMVVRSEVYVPKDEVR